MFARSRNENNFSDLSEQTSNQTLSLATKGTPLPVRLGKEMEAKKRNFSKDDLKHLQNQRQFTDNDMK